MPSPSRIVLVGLTGLVWLTTIPALAQTKTRSGENQAQTMRKEPHRVAIQITQNDPVLMNVALNNAENLVKYFEAKGEKVEIEFVAYGPGLHMVRSDTSPVKDRISSIAGKMKNISFSGCANTMGSQSKAEQRDVLLVSEARTVPTGIGRIVELQERGWTYVRP